MLIDNWKAVVTSAWSMRLMLVAVVLSGVEVMFPEFKDALGLDAATYAAVNGLIVAAAALSRILVQSNVTPEPKPLEFNTSGITTGTTTSVRLNDNGE